MNLQRYRYKQSQKYRIKIIRRKLTKALIDAYETCEKDRGTLTVEEYNKQLIENMQQIANTEMHRITFSIIDPSLIIK